MKSDFEKTCETVVCIVAAFGGVCAVALSISATVRLCYNLVTGVYF
ncbi:hypothetical protein bas27_0184 [Escherichia phage TrudiGerster]|uniref:Uncharacterized protein n=1 Tax=Escherichia phage TrudiGerster TaxID=2851991 RepID=A0AAE7W115_9CAUD|nr:hypothetical protein bas27_0184 [Escherichia phage TrudiGerster]